MRFTARRNLKWFLSFIFSLALLFFLVSPIISSVVHAQVSPTPQGGLQMGNLDPTATDWKVDEEVTEVGKNAERARQFLWWVFSHQAVHSAPVIAELWGFSRNIVYIFIIIVVVGLGLGIILSAKKGRMGPIFSGISSPVAGLNLPSVFVKIGGILLYVTFSYLIILAMIQISDITMQFFIHNVGGKDLFNIIFAGAGNFEENYKNFIGYKDQNILSREMINTSLSVIRITSLTYYVMALMVVLRTIILWFLLITSPFLAILMPFIFIRNVGWIWIGVFFQWLFYGPLFALFLAGITRIWVSGIPFPFDFTKVNRAEGQVYKTSINILYGGPAQTLSPGNTANYIDTYAEYLISLVMLWGALILPWFLLRIFRDYCCEVVSSGNAVLSSILDKIRQYPVPPPPSPVSPSTTSGMAVELPFRSRVEEKVREVSRISIEDIKEISKVNTQEIAKASNISVSSLTDISKLEMKSNVREETRRQLDKISAPEKITSAREREKYVQVKSELQRRAVSGDRLAQSILTASGEDRTTLISQISNTMIGQRSQVAGPRTKTSAASGIPLIIPNAQVFMSVLSQPNTVSQIARESSLKETQVKDVLAMIPVSGGLSTTIVSQISQKTGLPENKVKQIISLASSATTASKTMPRYAPTPAVDIAILSRPEVIGSIVKETGISESQCRSIITMLPVFGRASEENISKIAGSVNLTNEKVQEVIALVQARSHQVAVAREGKGEEGIPVQMEGKTVQSQVSVDEYEEVKKMWVNHFRQAPVPLSEVITNRQNWLSSEEIKLTNIVNLLSSSSIKQRQEGLEQVAEILPFMLLGGFSNVEILTYVKAKLEAERQVKNELELESRVKEKVEKNLKDEEEIVTVPAATRIEEAKHFQAEEKKSRLMGEDNVKENDKSK